MMTSTPTTSARVSLRASFIGSGLARQRGFYPPIRGGVNDRRPKQAVAPRYADPRVVTTRAAHYVRSGYRARSAGTRRAPEPNVQRGTGAGGPANNASPTDGPPNPNDRRRPRASLHPLLDARLFERVEQRGKQHPGHDDLLRPIANSTASSRL